LGEQKAKSKKKKAKKARQDFIAALRELNDRKVVVCLLPFSFCFSIRYWMATFGRAKSKEQKAKDKKQKPMLIPKFGGGELNRRVGSFSCVKIFARCGHGFATCPGREGIVYKRTMATKLRRVGQYEAGV
jgi:hypothetical protein